MPAECLKPWPLSPPATTTRESPLSRPMMNWPSGESVIMQVMTFAGRGSSPGKARHDGRHRVDIGVWVDVAVYFVRVDGLRR